MYWHSMIHWSGQWHGQTGAARSVLEQMYSTGELVIHHKEGARKYYDLAEKYLPPALLSAPDPLPEENDHLAWRVERRIGAVGLLWNRPSDAWLNLWGLNAKKRTDCFRRLLSEGRIQELSVEGVRCPLYCRAGEEALLERAMSAEALRPRCELLAPLDCLLWDRRLIRELFDFDYTWEIYTPKEKRKYGYYVLPLLYGENFVGRVEAVPDRAADTLQVRHIWYEDGKTPGRALPAAVAKRLLKFAAFNGCSRLEIPR